MWAWSLPPRPFFFFFLEKATYHMGFGIWKPEKLVIEFMRGGMTNTTSLLRLLLATPLIALTVVSHSDLHTVRTAGLVWTTQTSSS